MSRAKVFMSGRSQAVRLPKEFRFDGKEVSIRKEGESVILEPLKPMMWPRGFWSRIRIRDESFERPDQMIAPPVVPLDSR